MAILTVPLGSFTPDSADLVGPGPVNLQFVSKLANGHGTGLKPIRKFNEIAEKTAVTLFNPQSAIFKQYQEAGSNRYHVLWEGSDNKLYRTFLDDGTTISQQSAGHPGGYSANADGDYGYWLQSSEDFIWVNGVNFPQVSIAGAVMIDMATSTTKPKGRYVGVLNNHYVLACDIPNSKPDTVFWSGLNDYTDWDGDLSTGADEARLVDVPGKITGLYTGEFGLVFKRNGIFLMTYEGHPYTFNFQVLSSTYGTKVPRSIVAKGRNVYFLGDDGFKRVVDRSYIESVDSGKVRGFLKNVDSNYRVGGSGYVSSAAYDHSTGLISWTYALPTNSRRAMISYSEERDEWFFSEDLVVDTNYPYLITTGPVDQSFPEHQDALSSFVELRFNAVPTYKVVIGARTSSTYEAWQFKTKRIMLSDSDSVSVSGVRLIAKMADGSNASPTGLAVEVEYSNDPFFTTSSTVTSSAQSSNGWFPILIDAQFCRIKFSAPEASSNVPNQILAIQLDVSPGGSLGL
jgi:hypothetical protein